MAQVLDYSSGPPSGKAVHDAGYDGVVRYGGTPGRPKNITRNEFLDMARNGLGVALVFENQAGDALNGYGAGQAAARAIRADANNIGFPSDHALYFACDRDVVTEPQFAAVMSYLDGAASVLGGAHLVGVYGEHDVVKRALEGGHARYGWQTVAWSRGVHYAGAHLYQLAGYVYPGGVQCDASNVLQANWGQHNYLEVAEMTWGSDTTQLQIDDMQERIASMHFGKYQPIREGGLGGDLAWLDAKLAATREEILAGVRAQLAPLTDDEAVILAAVRAQPTGAQPSTEQMDALAAQLKASFGPIVAAELGRRLSLS